MSAEKPRSVWNANRREIVAVLAVVVLFSIFAGQWKSNGVEFEFGETQMTITGPEGAPAPVTLAYAEIHSATLQEDLDLGSMEDGLDDSSYRSGTWRNREFDRYTLCSCVGLSEYIVLETAKGTVVFNYQDADTTAHLYKAIVELLESKGLEVGAGAG